jgi:hypothetical protein
MSMRRLGLLLLLSLLAIALPTRGAAQTQQWSAVQQEVWRAVDGMCSGVYRGDVAALYQHVHPDLVWWNTMNDLPGDYATAKALDTAELMHGPKWLAGMCSPVTIQVFDTFAVVNAYARGLREGAAGQAPVVQNARLHFVMKKEGNQWLQVANYLDFNPRGM